MEITKDSFVAEDSLSTICLFPLWPSLSVLNDMKEISFLVQEGFFQLTSVIVTRCADGLQFWNPVYTCFLFAAAGSPLTCGVQMEEKAAFSPRICETQENQIYTSFQAKPTLGFLPGILD